MVMCGKIRQVCIRIILPCFHRPQCTMPVSFMLVAVTVWNTEFNDLCSVVILCWCIPGEQLYALCR